MSLLPWIVFGACIAGMLALDLGVFHRRAHEVRVKEALLWTGAWLALALLFGAGIGHWRGPERALEFLAGYLIELSLSVDNLFVFLLIFGYFAVPPGYQHKVLFWGILGALLMRLAFVAAGIALIHQFHWVIYVFGCVLVYSGIKLSLGKEQEINPEKNPLLRAFRTVVPLSTNYDRDRFVTKVNGRRMLTPLVAVLVVLETTDLMFAVDSVPAVIAITTDPFIVYTSNIFAILGLRSMFFALAGVMQMFALLHYGLAAVLVFVGAKMLLSGFWNIPTSASLMVVCVFLLAAILASVVRARRGAVPAASEPRTSPGRKMPGPSAGIPGMTPDAPARGCTAPVDFAAPGRHHP